MAKHRILVDIHSHTLCSNCGWNTHMEMAEAAAMQGLEAVAITDHGPSLGGELRRNFFLRFDGYWKGLRVLRGIEANITPEGTDVPPHLMPRFELILAGFHVGGPRQDIDLNTDEIIRVVETCPYVDVITHPLHRGFPLDIPRVAEVAAEHGVCLELNNSTLALGRCELPAVTEFVRVCRDNSYPIAVGSDAHSVSEVGKFEAVMPLLDDLNFPRELIVNRTLESTLEWLEARPAGITADD